MFGPVRGAYAPDLLIGPAGPARPDPARVAAVLPVPLVDTTDSAAGLLATATVVEPGEIARLVAATPTPSPELRLRLIRAHLDASDPAAAESVIRDMADEDPDDWRLDWFRGVAALVAGAPADAVTAFDAAYTALPGEPAVKLALAAAAECAGHDEAAGRYYTLVARPDPSQADAVFGLARVRLRTADPAGAVRALDAVPEASSRHVTAQLGAVQAILLSTDRRATGQAPTERPPTRPSCERRRPGWSGCRWIPPPTRRSARRCCTPRSVWSAGTRPGTAHRSSAAPGRSLRCGSRWNGACAHRPG